MASNKLYPVDVTGSRVVKDALKHYMKKVNKKSVSDNCFNAFDHGYVNAACNHASLNLFYGLEYDEKPLNTTAFYEAYANLRNYIAKKELAGVKVLKVHKDYYIAGYVAAFCLYENFF